MAKKRNISMSRAAGTLFCLLFLCLGSVQADEEYYGGVVVNIDRDVNGWLWISDATVNLYENAWIKDVYYNGNVVSAGAVWAESGAVLNIYGGKFDSLLYVTTSYNSFPEAQVTVYGGAFTVDGVPVVPGTAEIFLSNQVLGGVYESGTEFAFSVVCFTEGDFYMTVKLGWIDSAPDIEVTPDAVDFGEVEVGAQQSAFITIANTGNGNLSLQALAIQQAGEVDFGFMPLAQLPITIEPDSSVTVEVVFAPSAEGPYEALFRVFSDDPETPIAEAVMTGTGFIEEEPELTTKEKIDAIRAFYQAGLINGRIVGTGNGKNSAARAAAVGFSLAMAQNLIHGGYERLALISLESVASKTDGKDWPFDYVAGASVPELNAMVADLIENIKDEYPRKPKLNQYTKWHWWYKQHCRK